VITTNNCGAADLIKNDINGWIISSRSSLSIIDKLNYILNHPNEIERVGRNAIHTAQMRPWEKYNEDIMNTIQNICNKKNN
ncbi:MAG: glycosyltransferase, partial [Bacteroides sp.]|nr:glycosyltransferase [Bacteroides sp.]